MAFMDQIKRTDMKVSHMEVPTSFEWHLDFNHKPNAVYYPGDEIIGVRLKGVTVPTESTNSVMSIAMRGFTLKQSGLTINDGSITLQFQDFEDQSISAFLEDWIIKSNTRDTRRSVHKRDLYADITVTQLNVFRKPIRKWVCETCLPSGGAPGNTFSSDKTPLPESSLTLECEYITNKLLNIV